MTISPSPLPHQGCGDAQGLAQPGGTGSMPAKRPVYDPAVLDALPMVADGSQPEFAAQMRALFATTSVSALDEIDAALATGNNDVLLRRVHSLKSSSAQVGALELSDLAAGYEQKMRGGQPADGAWAEELRAAFERLRRCWRGLSTP